MNYAILKSLPHGYATIESGFASGAEAYARLGELVEITYGEEDADHPGCFDAFVGTTGSVYAIQPVGARY